MKKIILIFTLTFILLNVLVCGAHALNLQIRSDIPKIVEIISPKMIATQSWPFGRKAQTYLLIKFDTLGVEPNFVCLYGDEASKAWFEMATLAKFNQKPINIRYDQDCQISLTTCYGFESDCSCSPEIPYNDYIPRGGYTILGVFLDF